MIDNRNLDIKVLSPFFRLLLEQLPFGPSLIALVTSSHSVQTRLLHHLIRLNTSP